MIIRTFVAFASCLALVLIIGCGESIDPEILAARQKMMLKSAPAAPLSISDAKASTESPAEITLVGRISAGDIDPFDQQIAAFMLSELPQEHEQNEGHDADNCPFCKRRAANAPKAHVTMIDESDSPIPHAVPKLFGLKKGDQVIVQGTGSWNADLNLLEVKSRLIYLSP